MFVILVDFFSQPVKLYKYCSNSAQCLMLLSVAGRGIFSSARGERKMFVEVFDILIL